MRQLIRYIIDKNFAAPVFAAIIVAAATIIAAVIATSGGSSRPVPVSSQPSTTKPTTTRQTPTTTSTTGKYLGGRDLTVEDDVYGGAWAVTAPTLDRIYPREHRPPSARHWIPNGTNVTVRCSVPGHSYPVILNLHHTRWHWWAQLQVSRLWIPIAAFKQTLADGSQGFPRCSG